MGYPWWALAYSLDESQWSHEDLAGGAHTHLVGAKRLVGLVTSECLEQGSRPSHKYILGVLASSHDSVNLRAMRPLGMFYPVHNAPWQSQASS